MFKKTFLTAALILGLAFSSSMALAQVAPMGALPPEMVTALEKEKPLAQADIDAYLKVLPKMGQVAADPTAAAKLYQDAGMTEIRFSYVAAKVGLGMALASGATPQQLNLDQMPAVLKPSDAEVELVKKNLDKLQKAAMEMATSVQKAQ